MLNDIRNIVVSNMPYDTGNMFMRGARFIETDLYWQVVYDLNLVPYIYYQEEGTVHSTKNKGFISKKTENELQNLIAMRMNGMTEPYVPKNDNIRTRAQMVSAGVIENIRGDF